MAKGKKVLITREAHQEFLRMKVNYYKVAAITEILDRHLTEEQKEQVQKEVEDYERRLL